MADRSTKVVLVRSVREGVGASTISVGLAVALKALTDEHILFVDADHKNGDDLEIMLKNGCVRDVCSVRAEFSMYNDDIVRSCLEVSGLGIGVVRSHSSEVDMIADAGVVQIMKMYDWVIVDAGVDSRGSFRKLLKNGACCLVVGEEGFLGESRLKRCLAEDVVENVARDRIVAVINKSNDGSVPNIADVKKICQVRYDKSFRYGTFEALSRFVSSERTAANRDIAALSAVVKGLEYDPVALGGYKLTGEDVDKMKEEILLELQKTTGIKNARSGDAGLRWEMEEVLKRLTFKFASQFLSENEREIMVKGLLEEAHGAGPLECLLADPAVTDVMVNDLEKVYIERDGKLSRSSAVFRNRAQLDRVIERVVAPLGRRVDESSPMVDARLVDGSRVNVILPPLAVKGPVVTIRKFRSNILSTSDLVASGSMNREMAEFFERSVKARLNILVSGGTGSGKTTFLNVLSAFIPETERIITIEDSAELKLAQMHVVSLEARPPNIEGRGEVTIRDLVRNSLRMRPDRIIVGECRGGEALDMLQAMNTGHDGSMTTIHANNSRDALSRLETLVLFTGLGLPLRVIREQIVTAVDLVVQLVRGRDGVRRVVSVTEIVGLEGERITTQEIFSYSAAGASRDAGFVATGFVPKALNGRC